MHEADHDQHPSRPASPRHEGGVPDRRHRIGIGGELDTVENLSGGSVVLEFHDRVTIVMAASGPAVETTIAAVVAFGPPGQVGDDPIFMPSQKRAIGIRTGDQDVSSHSPSPPKR